MKKAVESGHVPHCIVPQCNGFVKPDIVFFGEQLPESFHQNRHVPGTADLAIVMGTSLTVQPFASLPMMVREGVPRVLINKEAVGDLGCRSDDVLILGDCDEGVRKLADALGWRDELERLWLEVNGKVKGKEAERLQEERKSLSKHEVLEAEIEKLTIEVDQALQISKDHTERVSKQLSPPSTETSSTGTGAGTPISDLASHPQPKNVSSLTSGVPTVSEEGRVEPPSTPAVCEAKQLNLDKVVSEGTILEEPAHAPVVKTGAILDVTLPQHRPDKVLPSAEKPAPKI
jgi:NAD-dependent histone deacetylase SIR2